MAAPVPAAVVGIDTGGTFTDVILLDAASGQLVTARVPLSPAHPSRSFGGGIATALGPAGIDGKA